MRPESTVLLPRQGGFGPHKSLVLTPHKSLVLTPHKSLVLTPHIASTDVLWVSGQPSDGSVLCADIRSRLDATQLDVLSLAL